MQNNKKYFTGWTKAQCIAICPNATELQFLFGMEQTPKEPIYYTDANTLRLDFFMKSFESNDFISKVTFWIKNNESCNKDGSKNYLNLQGKKSTNKDELRFVSYTGESQLLDFLKKIKNSRAGFKNSDETITLRTNNDTSVTNLDFDNLLINIKNNYETFLNSFDVWVRLYVKKSNKDGLYYQQIHNSVGYTWVKYEGLDKSEDYFQSQKSYLEYECTVFLGDKEYKQFIPIEEEANTEPDNVNEGESPITEKDLPF